jgi:hypothetical protein
VDRRILVADLTSPSSVEALNMMLRFLDVTWDSIVERGVDESDYDGIMLQATTLRMISRPSHHSTQAAPVQCRVFSHTSGLCNELNQWFCETQDTPHDVIAFDGGEVRVYVDVAAMPTS